MSSVSHLAKPLRSTRSRVTNGTTLFPGDVDGRSAEAKRFRDVLAEIASDLGGSEGLSEAQRQLSRRCAMLSVQGEKMEAEAMSTGAIDLDAYGSLSDRLSRLFARLGLKRVAREAIDLKSYIAAHAEREASR